MTDWIRRRFDSIGITQIPVGPFLRALQTRYGGAVILCIDVSGSMSGSPIAEATRGAQDFVAEAVGAHYEIGIVLWNSGVVGLVEPEADSTRCEQLLRRAGAGGGTNLYPALEKCHELLRRRTGDRVVAIFGDGDLGPKQQVLSKVSEMKRDDIRFVTRGLGRASAKEFAEVSSDDLTDVEVSDVRDLASGIAGMASTLKRAQGIA